MWKGYLTISPIHIANQVIEISSKYNKLFNLAFVNYEKEFDSVDIAAVLWTLKDQGVKETYIRLLKHIKVMHGNDNPSQDE